MQHVSTIELKQRIHTLYQEFRIKHRSQSIPFMDRVYYKKGTSIKLAEDTHTNEYFNKIADPSVSTSIHFPEQLRESKYSRYNHQFKQETYILNNTHQYLLMLQANGEMVKIRPLATRTPACPDQSIWIVHNQDYGYYRVACGFAYHGETYSTPTHPGAYSQPSNKEPMTDIYGYVIPLESMDDVTRTPIYVDYLNATISITDPNTNITDDEIRMHTAAHPKYAVPEIFLSKYKEDLLKEIASCDDYRIMVNDPTGTHSSYYACINNSIIKIAVTHDTIKKCSLSVVYKYPGVETGTTEERILLSIDDMDTVFKPSTTIVVPSNKISNKIHHRLICGTDYVAVQKALEHHYYYSNSTGCMSQAEKDEEFKELLAKEEKVWKDNYSALVTKLKKSEADNALIKGERDKYKDLYEQRLIAAEDERKAAIEQTKLQREQVATRGKEVSTTGDIAKIVIGACATLGGALIYYLANRKKKESEICNVVKTVSTGGILGGIYSFAVKTIKSAVSAITSPFSAIGSVFGLLF